MNTTLVSPVATTKVDVMLGDGTILAACPVTGTSGIVYVQVLLHGSIFMVEFMHSTVTNAIANGRPVRV